MSSLTLKIFTCFHCNQWACLDLKQIQTAAHEHQRVKLLSQQCKHLFSTASYFPSLSCLLRRMTSVSTAEASTGYPGQLVAVEAVQRSRCKGHHGWTQLRTTTKPPLHEQRETVKPCFFRQLQENRFCSTRVLSAFGALFCRPWVKGCYWYAVHPPKLNMLVQYGLNL